MGEPNHLDTEAVDGILDLIDWASDVSATESARKAGQPTHISGMMQINTTWVVNDFGARSFAMYHKSRDHWGESSEPELSRLSQQRELKSPTLGYGNLAAPARQHPMLTLQRSIGNRAMIQLLLGSSSERQAQPDNLERIREVAAAGIRGLGGALPWLKDIQKSFGRYDLSQVRAHVGTQAAEAAATLGTEAYAVGTHVAFAHNPTLRTAAHEAAHVVQQRAKIDLPRGIGSAGDHYERHAELVADAVSAGASTEALLDRVVAEPLRGSLDSAWGSPVLGAQQHSVQVQALGGLGRVGKAKAKPKCQIHVFAFPGTRPHLGTLQNEQEVDVLGAVGNYLQIEYEGIVAYVTNNPKRLEYIGDSAPTTGVESEAEPSEFDALSGVLDAGFRQMMSKPVMAPEEIAMARERIEKLPEILRQGFYLALQSKSEYRNQRDNESAAEKEKGGTCNLTSATDERERIFDSVSETGRRCWMRKAGTVPQILIDAVEHTQRGLADETEPEFVPFWQWLLRRVEAELREQQELLREEVWD